jgi:UDP-3-O-[3-hydroxymyristoyl] glucosamine N-acyltransferase
MNIRTKIKQNVRISSSEIILFLKKERLYILDNNIVNSSTNITSLDNSSNTSICWIGYKSYKIESLNANILIVGETFKKTSVNKSIIYTKNPRLAIVLLINKFFLESNQKEFIAKNAIIGENVKIGKNCIINSNVVIGDDVEIGHNVMVQSNTTIMSNCIIKNNVFIESGSRIGTEGQGHIYSIDNQYIQFPHISGVVIEDNVEIGANTVVVRGVLNNTYIGKNTKIGPSCVIGHNVVIGGNSMLAGNNAIAGSCTIGDNVWIGMSASISDGLNIGDKSSITIGSVVMNNVNSLSKVTGYLAQEHDKFLINYLRIFR